MRQEGVPARSALFQGQVQLKSRSGVRIALHRAQPPGVLLAGEANVQSAPPEAAQLGVCVLQDVSGYSLQETAREQHLPAREVRPLRRPQFFLQLLGQGVHGRHVVFLFRRRILSVHPIWKRESQVKTPIRKPVVDYLPLWIALGYVTLLTGKTSIFFVLSTPRANVQLRLFAISWPAPHLSVFPHQRFGRFRFGLRDRDRVHEAGPFVSKKPIKP